jgi:hypothetical protein
MKITINLDDDAAAIAIQYAESRELRLSEAISMLILRATRTSPRIKYVHGLPVFDMPRAKKPITTEDVKNLK